MVRLSSTAELAPESAASDTASSCPVARPKITESTTMPLQSHVIMIRSLPIQNIKNCE